MSVWRRARHYIDKSLGYHVFHLEEPNSGAQHLLQITLGHDACPLCGHVLPKDNLGQLTPYVFERQELEALDNSHANIDAYARKHQVPIRRPSK